MFQVVPDRFNALKDFFPEVPPNAPMLEAFLAMRAPGRAFVDDFRRPRACIVAMNYSFVFLGGKVSRSFFGSTIGLLRREQPVHVVWPVGRPPKDWLPPDKIIERMEFGNRTNGPDGGLLARLKVPTPPAKVRRINAELLRRCQWRDEVIRAVGSVEEFLRHGLGFCLMSGSDIMAEAYACFWGRERLEVATVTHPDHRGRGLATTACAHLIDACESLGFSTYWSCDAANQASRMLAARLGFTDPHPYRLLFFAKSPPMFPDTANGVD